MGRTDGAVPPGGRGVTAWLPPGARLEEAGPDARDPEGYRRDVLHVPPYGARTSGERVALIGNKTVYQRDVMIRAVLEARGFAEPVREVVCAPCRRGECIDHHEGVWRRADGSSPVICRCPHRQPPEQLSLIP